MVCKNCGREIGNGEKFCPGCGTAVEQVSQTQDKISEVSETSEVSENVTKKPKKGKKKLIAVLAVIVAIAVAFSITAFASPYVNNLLCKTFMSPEKYLAHVVNKSIKNSSDDVSSIIGILKEADMKNIGASYSVKATVGDSVWEMTGMDSDELVYVNWINDVELKGHSIIKDEKMQYDTTVNVNGTDIAGINALMEFDNEMMYMGFPEIMEKTVSMPLDGGDEIKEVFETIETIQSVIPDGKVVNNLLERYSKSAVSQIDKVKKSSDSIEAGGIKEKCTRLTVTINPKTAKNMVTALLKEAKNDNDIEEIVENIMDISGESFSKDDYTDAISQALDNIKDENLDFEDVSFYVYVNNIGEISGIGIDKKCIPDFDGEIFIGNCKKGNTTGTSLRFDVDGVEVEFSGKAVEEGGKVSGDYTLKSAGMEILSVKVSDQDVAKRKEGLASGTVTISLGDGLASVVNSFGGSSSALAALGDLSDIKLEVSANQDNKTSFDADIAIYNGSELIVKLACSTSIDNDTKISVPSNSIDIDDITDPSELGLKFDTILANLKEAGAPEEITGIIELAIAQTSGNADDMFADDMDDMLEYDISEDDMPTDEADDFADAI